MFCSSGSEYDASKAGRPSPYGLLPALLVPFPVGYGVVPWCCCVVEDVRVAFAEGELGEVSFEMKYGIYRFEDVGVAL